ncbi:aminotransferase class IV [Alcaligenaceae bacterium]|nr:aminotransferase class IV [Alcaligenaceae bacterium]
MSQVQYILMDGKPVPFHDARIHALSPAVTYAATVFEGIRAYWNPEHEQLYVFRLREHMQRLRQSVRMMRYDIDISVDELSAQVVEILSVNRLKADVYARIMAVVTSEDHPAISTSGPVSIIIAPGYHTGAGPWRETGMHVSVSSWQRINDSTHPPRIKATANYSNGRLAMLDAQREGYDSTIMLTRDGKVAEAPVASVFVVREGRLLTPRVTDGILESLTRATLLELFRTDLGGTACERAIDRTELYVADEIFLCASGIEVVPVASVDRLPTQHGAPGPVTQAIRDRYQATVRGDAGRLSWLTPVYPN